jgi:hypothetical protein
VGTKLLKTCMNELHMLCSLTDIVRGPSVPDDSRHPHAAWAGNSVVDGCNDEVTGPRADAVKVLCRFIMRDRRLPEALAPICTVSH